MLLGEYFSAERAWSLAAVNPTARRSATGGSEPALAARVPARRRRRLARFARLALHHWRQRARLPPAVNESLEPRPARYLRQPRHPSYSADSPPLSASATAEIQRQALGGWLDRRQLTTAANQAWLRRSARPRAVCAATGACLPGLRRTS